MCCARPRPPSARSAAARSTPSGSTSCRSTASLPRSSVFGTSTSEPAVMARRAGRCRRRAAARRCGSGAGRRALSDRPTRSPPAARCRTLRSWRCRRSRRAVRRAGSARCRLRQRPEAHAHRQGWTRAKAVTCRTTASAVWKTKSRPLMRRSCAVACAWSPGLPRRLAVEVGDLVGADHHRVRMSAATARAFAAQAVARVPPAPRPAAGSRQPRARRR